MDTTQNTQNQTLEAAELTDILTPETAAYATELRAHGYSVHVATSTYRTRPLGWFIYSRPNPDAATRETQPTVWGTFDDGSNNFDGPKHTMPIKPSRENGSSILVHAAETCDPFTVEAADAIAQPSNRGIYVTPGQHKNYRGAEAMASYREFAPTSPDPREPKKAHEPYILPTLRTEYTPQGTVRVNSGKGGGSVSLTGPTMHSPTGTPLTVVLALDSYTMRELAADLNARAAEIEGVDK